MAKSVFVSGCSSGIGLYIVKALKAKGYKVVASCRRAKDLEPFAALGIDAIHLDVNDSISISKAVHQLLEITGGTLDVLINNAGYGQVGALEDVSPELMLKQFQTNVFGLHALTQKIIPIMRAQGSGRIINISSVLGKVALPFRGAYCASKYAVEGLSDAWRMELESSSIQVISIQPGAIQSRFRETAVDVSLQSIDMDNSFFINQYLSMLARFKSKKNTSMSTKGPGAVFKKVVHAIESKKPKMTYSVTLGATLLIYARKIFPERWLHRLLVRLSRRELVSKHKFGH